MLKLQLVDDWQRSWRWASVRLSWVFGILVIVDATFHDQIDGLIAYVPEKWRPLATLAGSVLAVAIPWAARILKKQSEPAQVPDAGV